jgi:NADPH-dependent glutamate synthase beta subunit-like oxidoreductase/glutamate synthase domain-containing protein 3/NAD-dependent dihydropyrimidine dehydrogenase PreA subunit
MLTIVAKGLYYKALNRQIRESLSHGAKEIILKSVLGQRYIAGGINASAVFHIYGTPGQDLGAFMNGPHLIVYGNAQDGVGNTMNSGKIIVHGKAGEIPGHSMRGGKIFIKGDVEYRAGIHMKEYLDQIPCLIIGGTAKDYCGEYMAGGRVVVLNLNNKKPSPVGYSVGTGIHGGAIYVRGNVQKYQLGPGAIFADIDESDEYFLKNALNEYKNDMDVNLNGITINEFVKITKLGHRPFAKLYTPAMNLKTKMPKHFNLTPPCTLNCPTGIPTPVFFNLIKEGKVKEAQLLMDEYTPFRASVCGTACPAPCMDACNRNVIDGPIQIQKLAQTYYPKFKPVVKGRKKKEIISIIGAGPSGLSAAWQLSRRGYQVRVYDAMDDLGGKVRKAIPRERLSDETLNKDIKRIRSLPIQFNLGVRIDRAAFDEIYNQSEIVVIATGAHITKRIPYNGGDRILSGLEFLMDINDGKPMDLSGKDVAIVGAGNVGMDMACESWRLGAKKVTAIDIQKPLASGKELALATELGTEVLWPRAIERLDAKKIYFKDGTTIKADVVFFSIGEIPDASFLPDSVLLDERGYMITSEKSFRSSDIKIYGCGDIYKPGLITDAVGSGRLAAMEIHATLAGEEFVYPEKNLVPTKRIQTVYFGGEENEIDRCMSCGTCIFCDMCIEQCPHEAISRNGEIFTIDPVKCTLCYTCVNVCPRGAIQSELLEELIYEDGA